MPWTTGPNPMIINPAAHNVTPERHRVKDTPFFASEIARLDTYDRPVDNMQSLVGYLYHQAVQEHRKDTGSTGVPSEAAAIKYIQDHIKGEASRRNISYNDTSTTSKANVNNAIAGLFRSTDSDMVVSAAKSLGNEIKHTWGGAKPLTNAVIGLLPFTDKYKLRYQYNPNDQYLRPWARNFRDAALQTGEQAGTMALELFLGTKLVSPTIRAMRRNRIPGKTIVNFMADDASLYRSFKAWRHLKPSSRRALSILGTLWTGGEGIDWVDNFLMKNRQTRLRNAELTDEECYELGITPNQMRTAFRKNPEGWVDDVGISEDKIDPWINWGAVPASDDPKTPAPEPPKPWYHDPRVGIGAGIVGGSLTGYGVARALGGGATSRILAALGGGTVGGVLGKVIQDKILKR